MVDVTGLEPGELNLSSPLTRVVTVIVRNKFVYREDENSGPLKGICVDLWKQIAEDLKITYAVEEADFWTVQLKKFKEDKADVIMQRINEEDMLAGNITE